MYSHSLDYIKLDLDSTCTSEVQCSVDVIAYNEFRTIQYGWNWWRKHNI